MTFIVLHFVAAVFFFQTGFFCCSPGHPGTPSVDQVGPKLRDLGFCLPSAGIKDTSHHTWTSLHILKQPHILGVIMMCEPPKMFLNAVCLAQHLHTCVHQGDVSS